MSFLKHIDKFLHTIRPQIQSQPLILTETLVVVDWTRRLPHRGPVHTNAFLDDNGYVSLRSCFALTLLHAKTELNDNGAEGKRIFVIWTPKTEEFEYANNSSNNLPKFWRQFYISNDYKITSFTVWLLITIPLAYLNSRCAISRALLTTRNLSCVKKMTRAH